MDKNTTDNLEDNFIDPIEERQMDKFICDEMGRQIHRYIKGMSGSLEIMLKFEAKLKGLTIPEREDAIARYIDLNRKALHGLDPKIVIARAMANYCDTFEYLLELVHDEQRMEYYLNRMNDKYIRYHEVFEENGKFGIKDHNGNVIISAQYDFLRTVYTYVDDLVIMPIIAQKGKKMGLVLPDGNDTVFADFVYDDISLRDEYPYFEARKGQRKGLIDQKGQFITVK